MEPPLQSAISCHSITCCLNLVRELTLTLTSQQSPLTISERIINFRRLRSVAILAGEYVLLRTSRLAGARCAPGILGTTCSPVAFGYGLITSLGDDALALYSEANARLSGSSSVSQRDEVPAFSSQFDGMTVSSPFYHCSNVGLRSTICEILASGGFGWVS